jgi:DNA-binding MarR family transcriptional regulator
MMQLLRWGKKSAEASPQGPRLPKMMVLACLDEFGPQSQRELSGRLWLDPSDMVAIIDRLEADGHAIRERDPQDRRRHAIAMTPAGRAALADMAAGLGARTAALLPGLASDERAQVLDLLRRALAHHDDRVPDHFREKRST